MRNEQVPTPSTPAQPPLTPYDPPDPVPQAAAWRRALKVIGCEPRATLRIGKTAARHLMHRHS
jgi:hypothetical protein